ncbi:terpene synthase family protein [Streptomyces spectabilis]|uniref:Terpene synthase n=2 Tax=Streptomyces spectabilis TaxID=68270 RepID=A0A5P2X9M5_STRST|nr:hypothetical protein [Streptomyces spectabilis]MBB5103388.1 hypothetical protein [Streptomyces spectabilis]MCI3902578.1 hypothetical protein [Streptomyces spectabilis]QEV59905.1 hypothetical protein CP982_15125 [Streptomyces spectabilis]
MTEGFDEGEGGSRVSAVPGDVPVHPAFRLPDMTRLLPGRLHPDAARMHEAVHEWCRSELRAFFSDQVSFNQFLEHHVDLWTYLTVPVGDPDVIEATCELTFLFLVLDDKHGGDVPGSAHGDEGLSFRGDAKASWSVADHLAAIMHGGAADPSVPFAGVFQRLWQRLTRGMREPLRERFADCLNAFIGGAAAEVAPRPQGSHPDFDHFPQYTRTSSREYRSFEEYRSVREHSIGARYLYVLHEHALGIDMTEVLRRSEALQRVERTVVHQHLLHNDLLSYRKELLAGQRDNTLAVLQDTEGLSLQQAVDRLWACAEEAEDDFLRVRERILHSSLGRRGDVRRYLEQMWWMVPGSIEYQLMSPRYHGLGYRWSGYACGEFVLHPEQTVLVPPPGALPVVPAWRSFIRITPAPGHAG